MKCLLIFALFAVAYAQYEPAYQEGAGMEAGAYQPEGGAYEGGAEGAAYGHDAGVGGGYEEAPAGYGEQEGVEHGGAEAYGAAGQYGQPQGGYEQYEAYV